MVTKSLLVAAVLIVLLGAAINVQSHGGQLNSEGCHHDKKVRERHCHQYNTKAKAVNSGASASYDRSNWQSQSSGSPVSSFILGWYTGINGSATDVDHVVALKDAYLSGGNGWNISQKRAFANDPFNHVAAVPYVNRTLKSEHVPLKFITKLPSSDYAFSKGKCIAYVELYVQVKLKYGLSFVNNNINAAKKSCRQSH